MNSPDPPIPLIPTPSPIRSAESFVARGLCLCAILGTLTRYLGRWHWVFEITTHFVVQATVLDGLTSREAGHLLGIPAGTVKSRMMRARRQLREALV